MTNIITANLSKCRFYRASPVYQYNYGMILKITGIDLPTAYEVDFSNDVNGTSITQIGNADGVTIPAQFFTPGQAIYAWLRVHPTVDSGVTTATIVIPISPRATITDDEPTPEEQSAIDEAIAALNDAVDKAEDAVEHYPQITNGIWYVWDVDAGEYVSTGVPAQGAQGNPGVDGQDGTDGFSPVATVTQTASGATISITDKTGTTTANISNGQDGSPGQPGTDGADGISPTVTVTDITGGHRVTITDAEHPTGQTFDVMNGQDGQPGTDGTDGVGVPAGGTTGQVLAKSSDSDYSTEWTTPEAGGVTDIQVNGQSVVTDGVANVTIGNGLYFDNGVLGVDSAFELIRFIQLEEDTQIVTIDTDESSQPFSLKGFMMVINSVGASGATNEAFLKIAVNSNNVAINRVMDMGSGIRKSGSKRGIFVYGPSIGGIAHYVSAMFADNYDFINANGVITEGWPQTGNSSYNGMSGLTSISKFMIGSSTASDKLGAGSIIALYGHKV